MEAIIQTGGKQFRVKPGDIINVEKISANIGDTISIDNVLYAKGDDLLKVGTPTIEEAEVKATVINQDRGKKILVYKFKKRKNYRKKNGHRQDYTQILINGIYVDGVSYEIEKPTTESVEPVQDAKDKHTEPLVTSQETKAASPEALDSTQEMDDAIHEVETKQENSVSQVQEKPNQDFEETVEKEMKVEGEHTESKQDIEDDLTNKEENLEEKYKEKD